MPRQGGLSLCWPGWSACWLPPGQHVLRRPCFQRAWDPLGRRRGDHRAHTEHQAGTSPRGRRLFEPLALATHRCHPLTAPAQAFGMLRLPGVCGHQGQPPVAELVCARPLCARRQDGPEGPRGTASPPGLPPQAFRRCATLQQGLPHRKRRPACPEPPPLLSQAWLLHLAARLALLGGENHQGREAPSPSARQVQSARLGPWRGRRQPRQRGVLPPRLGGGARRGHACPRGAACHAGCPTSAVVCCLAWIAHVAGCGGHHRATPACQAEP